MPNHFQRIVLLWLLFRYNKPKKRVVSVNMTQLIDANRRSDEGPKLEASAF